MVPASAGGREGGVMRIACQGTEGAYSQIAARRMFPDADLMYFRQFDAVARAVSGGMCGFGVLPIENNTYGSVKEVYRVMGRESVSIVRSYTLRIDHVLLAPPGTRLEDVTAVYSHEQALGQCGEFLHSLGNRVRQVACLNTAVAARTAAETKDGGGAVIASPECAKLYGLQILKRHIADSDSNYTRFICVARTPRAPEGTSRVSLMLSLPHRPGSLAAVLNRFAEKNLNLLKLESDPIPGRDFEFRFYIDLEVRDQLEDALEILKYLEAECPAYRLLGFYTEESQAEDDR